MINLLLKVERIKTLSGKNLLNQECSVQIPEEKSAVSSRSFSISSLRSE